MAISFQLLHGPDPAGPRLGRVTTPHGTFDTPAFMPVGTLASVKSLLPGEVAGTGAEILLVNAYHLYLRPGHERVARLGGVHRFMGWDGPILSDSGGFQVFSLRGLRKVDDSGVRFRSHIDGSEHHYTPELAAQVQSALGVDIAMPLDHVVPGDAPPSLAAEAAERTLRWYIRARDATPGQSTFAILQGGTDPGLRAWHARELAALNAPGYSIGGLSVGETKALMWAMTGVVTPLLPLAKPRYLMGVGSPEDLVNGVALGVDMFDCVLPTRLGRNGALFTDDGRVNIRNARFQDQRQPLDADCDQPCCRQFTAAYLAHLFRNDELLGYRLATLHNVRYLVRLTERMRLAIGAGAFAAFAADYLARYRPTDEGTRIAQKERWANRER